MRIGHHLTYLSCKVYAISVPVYVLFAARTLLTAPSVFPRWNYSHFGLDCYFAEELPIFSVAPDQWLIGISAITLTSIPKPMDTSPSFPVDALAIPPLAESIQPQPVEQRSANPQRFAISTLPAEMSVPQIDTLTPTALADSVSISGFLTWSQVLPSRRTSESTVFSSRNPASLTTSSAVTLYDR